MLVHSRQTLSSKMAGGETVEIAALTKNLGLITDNVQNNLQWFANCLVAEGFTPHRTARAILGNNRRAPGELTGDLMDEVLKTIENAEDKRAWFDKFVAIFSQSRAHYDLVERLKRCDNGTFDPCSISQVPRIMTSSCARDHTQTYNKLLSSFAQVLQQ